MGKKSGEHDHISRGNSLGMHYAICKLLTGWNIFHNGLASIFLVQLIWKEQNQKCVKDNQLSFEKFKDQFMPTLIFWLQGDYFFVQSFFFGQIQN